MREEEREKSFLFHPPRLLFVSFYLERGLGRRRRKRVEERKKKKEKKRKKGEVVNGLPRVLHTNDIQEEGWVGPAYPGGKDIPTK